MLPDKCSPPVAPTRLNYLTDVLNVPKLAAEQEEVRISLVVVRNRH